MSADAPSLSVPGASCDAPVPPFLRRLQRWHKDLPFAQMAGGAVGGLATPATKTHTHTSAHFQFEKMLPP